MEKIIELFLGGVQSLTLSEIILGATYGILLGYSLIRFIVIKRENVKLQKLNDNLLMRVAVEKDEENKYQGL